MLWLALTPLSMVRLCGPRQELGIIMKRRIWIGQASYTAITDEPVSYIFFKWEKIPPVAFQLQELV